MNEMQQMVRQFHEVGGHPIAESPQLLTQDRAEKRAKWSREEIQEFLDAIEAKDIEEAYDAIIDLLYFAYGTAVEMGLDVEPGFRAVHEANMAKFPGGVQLRDADGKVMKPEGWVAPDHTAEVEKQRIDAEVERLVRQVSQLEPTATLPYSIAADLAKLPVEQVSRVVSLAAGVRTAAKHARMLASLREGRDDPAGLIASAGLGGATFGRDFDGGMIS